MLVHASILKATDGRRAKDDKGSLVTVTGCYTKISS